MIVDFGMVGRVIFYIVGLPLVFVLVLFSVSNRDEVIYRLWPLVWEVSLPSYVGILGALFIGLLLSSIYYSWRLILLRGRVSGASRRADEQESLYVSEVEKNRHLQDELDVCKGELAKLRRSD